MSLNSCLRFWGQLQSDHEHFDSQRVKTFLDAFDDLTWTLNPQSRVEALDKRINEAALSLGDKIEAFKQIAGPGWQSSRDELRMERLICSVATVDLSLFKYAVEYDGDYKDIEEYLCHDIDDEGCRSRVLAHLRKVPSEVGVKVLSDVDDTMYANLCDDRYPRKAAKKSFYPGVVEFYDALKREPFAVEGIPVTTLSARPNPVGGTLEEGSIGKLAEYSNGRLRPSGLSGDLVSSTIGTFQTLAQARLGSVVEGIPHGQEDKIGIVKFRNFANFAAVYPEYRYVFVGDSGQADALTAQLMLDANLAEGSPRVITTFIHDLRWPENDYASPAFKELPAEAKVTSASRTGRGVVVFRNYIEAALVAFTHSKTLDNLITPDGLARVTRAALQEFLAIDFQTEGKGASQRFLRERYLEDGEEAYRLLTLNLSGSPSLREDLSAIRRTLDELKRSDR